MSSTQLAWLWPAVDPVEQLDDVQDRLVDDGADLHQASDIAGGDDVGAGRLDVLGLPRLKAPGDFRLQHVVGAGGAAADVSLDRLAHGEARLRKQRLRRRLD